MKSTLTILLLSFLATSCYTQFATVRDDYPEDYTIREERRVYDNNESDNYNDEEYYEDSDFSISDQNYQNAAYDDYYYEDEYEPAYVAEYHYSARPYVYNYRFIHYDPWDPYWYDYYPYSGVRISMRFGHRYDPYWISFNCGPYDYWYYDSWDYYWCGYPYVRYEPYYPYYGGYYDWGWGYDYGYYGRHHYRYPRYVGSVGHKEQRGFSSSKPSLTPARPARSPRTPLIGSNSSDRINTPDLKPVISRPGRTPGVEDNRSKPFADDEVRTMPVKSRPVVDNDRNRRNPVEKPKTLDHAARERQSVQTKVKESDSSRRYERKYFNTSRVKRELNTARNEAKSNVRSRYPVSKKSRSDYGSGGNDTYTKPTRSREAVSTGVRSSRSSNDTYSRPKPKYDKPRTIKRSAPSRESRPTYDRKSKSSSSSSKSINRSRSSSRSESRPSYNRPSRSSRPSYSPPSRSSSSSRSSVRSAPSKSSSRSSAPRSSSGSSSSRGKRK